MKECFAHLEELLREEEKNYKPSSNLTVKKKIKPLKAPSTASRFIPSTSPIAATTIKSSTPVVTNKYASRINDINPAVNPKQITLFKWKINLETMLRWLFVM